MKKTTKAEQIQNLFNNIRSSERNLWLLSSQKAFAFFLGNQLTKEEYDSLVERKMPTFIVNKMTPQIELMMFFLTAKTPRWQAVGVDGTDSEVADMHAKVAEYVWSISKGQTIFSQTVRDSLTKGVGYFHVSIDPDMDDGFGEVIIESIEPWDVYVDPHSRDPFFEDASYILISKTKTVEQIQMDFPELSRFDILKSSNVNDRDYLLQSFNAPAPVHSYDVEDGYSKDGSEVEYIRTFEFYEKKKIPYVNAIYKVSGEIQNAIMPKKEWNKIKDSIPSENIIEILEFNKKKVFKTFVIGSEVIENEIEMPSERYPIIPLCYRHTGNPYPLSAAMDLVGKQEEINKSHQIMIHHANLSSVPRWLAENGAITDKDEFRKHSSTPGAVLEYNPDTQGNPPTPVQPLPLNNAFYTITKEGVIDMEYISGMSAYMQGQGEMSGREPYRGLLARDDFGTRRIRGFATNVLNEFLTIVGKVVDDYATFLYRTQKTISITSPEDPEAVKIFTLNEIGKDDIAKFYDRTSTRYNIKFVAGSTLLVNRWAELEEYMELYRMGVIDRETLLYKTDLPNKKAIVKKTNQLEQLSSKVEQLSEQLEKMKKENEILERALINARITTKVAEAQADIESEKAKFIARLKIMLEEGKLTGKQLESEIRNFVRELELDVKESKINNKINDNINNTK